MDALVPASTRKARVSARSAFARFLAQQDVREDYVLSCIGVDATGARLVAVIERFGLFLVCMDGKDGKPLAVNSVLSYYRNVKVWLIGMYPLQRVYAESALSGKANVLKSACKRRKDGGFVHSAPPCTKDDLGSFMECMYVNAVNERDYQDAALLCLMWQCFGRASDLAYARKEHLAMSADGTLFVRLLRVKTAQEQGLALVPDSASYLVCPLFALASALAMQRAPSSALLSQLPALVTPAAIAADDGAPLYALLEADVSDLRAAATVAASGTIKHKEEDAGGKEGDDSDDADNKKTKTIKNVIGVHGYINRLLKRLSPPRQVTEKFTSHSFRRGGAQHANGCDRLSAQWILDRGGWSMSATNKGFAYIFNTPREDRKVAHVLSGWHPDQKPVLADAAQLDSRAKEGLGLLRDRLFASCSGHAHAELNVDKTVLDALTATLVRHYPRAKALQEKAPLVVRLEVCVTEAGHDSLQLLSWSAALEAAASYGAAESAAGSGGGDSGGAGGTNAAAGGAVQHSAVIIAELVAMNRAMSKRLRVVETALLAKQGKSVRAREEPVHEQAEESERPPKKRKKGAATSPAAMWYEWYTRVPRMWEAGDKQRRSEACHLVAFMRLFLVDGYELLESSGKFRDEVLALGEVAEAAALAFLRERGLTAASSGTVLREMRKLHRAGELNDHIAAYRVLRAANRIVDPSPAPSLDVLALSSSVAQ